MGEAMIANQTIDGVPRELLQRVCAVRTTSAGWISSADAIRELRDLLDNADAGISASAMVVLPERRSTDEGTSDADQHTDYGWNACLDELIRLNSTRPTHANPPSGAEPNGTHHDNDGLDEWRKP